MSNMIGKSGIDWSKAPEGATHVLPYLGIYGRAIQWCTKEDSSRWKVWRESGSGWYIDSYQTTLIRGNFISKEEDLRVTRVKEVKSIKDLEVGMFVAVGRSTYVIVELGGIAIEVAAVPGRVSSETNYIHSFNSLTSWSYSLSQGWCNIKHVNETDKKLKELEETIAKAQRQIAELRGK